MKTSGERSSSFENISDSGRVTRFVISVIAVVTAMSSPIVGTSLFAAVNLLAIGLATLAIIGWDPVVGVARSMGAGKTGLSLHHRDRFHTGKHA